METRYISLSLETAKRWYQQGGELKDMALGVYTLEEMDYEPPKTWEDYIEMCKMWHIIVGTEDCEDKNPQIAAVKKLILLRDFYNNHWKPKWDDYCSKIVIKRDYQREEGEYGYHIERVYSPSESSWLIFDDEEYAKKFLENFRELIEEAGDLI